LTAAMRGMAEPRFDSRARLAILYLRRDLTASSACSRDISPARPNGFFSGIRLSLARWVTAMSVSVRSRTSICRNYSMQHPLVLSVF
ncbi:hypothetical protein, partial [Mesorhizobium sp. M7A.F.Ca.CA.001.08.1.1]|uniref:hypothetical protein n=1 Tax=Mesorhizobium sp. M7A.F.Ca.CA.001.08.1.1 TaxID=2496691 RepID=UPI0019D00617